MKSLFVLAFVFALALVTAKQSSDPRTIDHISSPYASFSSRDGLVHLLKRKLQIEGIFGCDECKNNIPSPVPSLAPSNDDDGTGNSTYPATGNPWGEPWGEESGWGDD